MRDLFAISIGCATVIILVIATVDWAVCGIVGLDGRLLVPPGVTLIVVPTLTGAIYLFLLFILRGFLTD